MQMLIFGLGFVLGFAIKSFHGLIWNYRFLCKIKEMDNAIKKGKISKGDKSEH